MDIEILGKYTVRKDGLIMSSKTVTLNKTYEVEDFINIVLCNSGYLEEANICILRNSDSGKILMRISGWKPTTPAEQDEISELRSNKVRKKRKRSTLLIDFPLWAEEIATTPTLDLE